MYVTEFQLLIKQGQGSIVLMVGVAFLLGIREQAYLVSTVVLTVDGDGADKEQGGGGRATLCVIVEEAILAAKTFADDDMAVCRDARMLPQTAKYNNRQPSTSASLALLSLLLHPREAARLIVCALIEQSLCLYQSKRPVPLIRYKNVRLTPYSHLLSTRNHHYVPF
jgi:hypothetical protein